MVYKIEVSAHVTILETQYIQVEAPDRRVAEENADERFMEYLKDKYGWCDFDEVHFDIIDEYKEE